ncbi:type II toxin-antitoxin system RelE/ParE family toxin [endosymbiont GvMRE of Glomus versiforme]|uniref:type II toxin-antitoxin system RelE/ParE family toxin n=1 Tax=endosymbiont GvMRE of Glomus versiforme TaxID=2039283 RepID=UPI0011C40006|nr:type II toxin-antitoxin system RelE/ParE family toxin [endosymbiont GvMRE of Glomus versiforme]
MIISFRDKDTEKLFRWKKNPKWGQIEQRALRRLELLDAVPNLEELKKIPGLDLHNLKGDLTGYKAIDINKQFRLIFIWGKDNHAYKVGIIDYH